MSTHFRLRLTGTALFVLLPSCGLIKAPFQVAGAVVDGTAMVGKKAYKASTDPFKKTPEEKAAAAKEKEAKEAKEAKEKEAKDAAANPGQLPVPPPVEPALPQQAPGQTPSDDYLPPPPADPPAPDNLPYQGR